MTWIFRFLVSLYLTFGNKSCYVVEQYWSYLLKGHSMIFYQSHEVMIFSEFSIFKNFFFQLYTDLIIYHSFLRKYRQKAKCFLEVKVSFNCFELNYRINIIFINIIRDRSSSFSELVMYSRILTYMNQKFFSDLNIGIWKEDPQIRLFINLWTPYRNRNLAMEIFVDLGKAFDCVNHQISLNKLLRYGISVESQEWIKSFLFGRQ